MESKCESMDRVFIEHVKWADHLTDDVRAIHAKLATNGERLVDIASGLKSQNKEIQRIWAFPRNVLIFLGALGTAGVAVYGLARVVVKIAP